MAKILADKDIKKLVGNVIIDGDDNLLNPNGIELRLGRHVLFHSTGEEVNLEQGNFLKISPGETASISSIETIDFKASAVQAIFPGCMLMGFITPTTTMMREGISQVSTKVDAGFCGILNWGIRNGSTKDLILQFGEPIFKLTVFCLEEDETPELAYGERISDNYQNSEGITRSARRIPADIPKSKMVCSSFGQLDPKKQLREAGYPFDHIGQELTNLHGKFELVSTDVRMMKDEFKKQTEELSKKIDNETVALSQKIEENRKSVLEKVESIFDKKFIRIIGIVIGSIPIMYGGVSFMQGTSLGGKPTAFIAAIVGIIILLLTYFLSRKSL